MCEELSFLFGKILKQFYYSLANEFSIIKKSFEMHRDKRKKTFVLYIHSYLRQILVSSKIEFIRTKIGIAKIRIIITLSSNNYEKL